MKEQRITMKISYGGFFIDDKVYFPSLTLRDRYNRGTVIEAKQVYRETSKLLPFFRGKYIIENRLLIKPDGGEQPVEVLANECYKCHDNAELLEAEDE